MLIKNSDYSKSFEPIISNDTEILLLGSLPGQEINRVKPVLWPS